MSQTNLDLKYRPRTFDDVRGQERSVAYLSNLVKRREKPRSVILFGSVGSGKTTLARIYSRAINCSSPTASGSPCDHCANCLLPDSEHRREFNVPAEASKKDILTQKVAGWLEAWNRTPDELPFRTIFFDEAHHLKGKASDVLLKAVEEPAAGVIFIFATTEIAEMRLALLSRLAHLEIQPLSLAQSIDYLREITDAERIPFEESALALLASVKNGYPRDLVIGLEQVIPIDGGSLTRERVKTIFDLDHLERLVDYLRELASGDHRSQTGAFLSWRETSESKLRWVQSAWLAIYYRHILFMDIEIDPLIEAIDRDVMTDLLGRFCRRFNVSEPRDLIPAFRPLIEFWAAVPPAVEQTQILLHVACFHDLLRSLPTSRTERHAVLETARPAVSGRVAEPTSPGVFEFGEPRFIGRAEVEDIVRAATFLPQEYGKLFNVHFTLVPALFGIDDEKAGYALAAEFLRDLAAADVSDGGGWLPYVAQFERSESGLVVRILTHCCAAASGGSVEARWSGWKGAERRLPSALIVDELPLRGARALKSHWQAALELCKGLGEDVCPEEGSAPLLQLLGIKRARDARPVRGPLVQVCPELSLEAWQAADGERMGLLSAYREGAWDQLQTGWELREWADRSAERQRRKTAVLGVEKEFGKGSAEAVARIAELERTWPTDPRDRQRSWVGWWTNEEI